jgi:hypothetical protein
VVYRNDIPRSMVVWLISRAISLSVTVRFTVTITIIIIIFTHRGCTAVPSPPRTLLVRLKFLEDHIVRLEKDYPPWAALHFNQPNRGVRDIFKFKIYISLVFINYGIRSGHHHHALRRSSSRHNLGRRLQDRISYLRAVLQIAHRWEERFLEVG